MKLNLTEDPVGPTLRALALPMMLGIVFIIALNIADTYFVGMLGTRELAAMAFTFPVVSFVMSLAMGLGIGTTSAISRAIGAGDEKAVRRLTTHALALAIGIVALVSVGGLATQSAVFRALGAEEALIPLLEEYMTIWYAGAIFLVVPMVANGIMRAGGDAKTPAYIMMAAAVVNVLLDPLLIFGLGPVPGMGLTGAAIATVIARAITMGISGFVLAVRMKVIDLHIPTAAELLDSWKRVLSVGAPAAVTNALVPVAAAMMTAIVAAQGAAAVAGFGIGTRMEGLLLIAPMGIGAALTPLIGQNWGAHRVERVEEALRIAKRFVLVWGLGAWLVLLPTSAFVSGLFTDDSTVEAAATAYLWIVPIGYGAHGVVSVASSAFNAVDRALRSTALSGLRSLFLAVPLAFVGSEVFGLDGVFGGIALASLVSGLVAHVWLRRVTGEHERPRPAIAEPVASAIFRVKGAVETAIDGLLESVVDMPHVTVAARPINTLGFYAKGWELAHVHRNGHLDLHLPPPVQKQLIAEGRADHHRHVSDASLLSYRLEGPEDVEGARWLIAVAEAFHRLRTAGEDQATLDDLDALEPSEETRALLLSSVRRCRAHRAA